MIIFDQVSKKFFNNTYGVKDVSFAVDPGELILVTGPTGSGKTTLMRLITKEYLPSEGKIIFDGVSLADIKSSLIPIHRRRIGVVFQDYRLLPESNVWENVALPLLIANKSKSEIEERVTDLLKLVKLEDKFELFPNELSGGEAQRVSIARALAVAPPVLFADEPTGNLDPESSRAIIKLLKKINQLGTTVLISTHDIIVLEELADIRHLKLDNGDLVMDAKAKKDKIKKKEQTKTKSKKTTSKKKKKETQKTEEKIENLEDKPQKQEKK